eukprot:TRINITY_DN464_c0_g2_i4.p1 TRINITY_DN464_c0_g2~~TRINITY_DN464_c0_g2_i4.p1  ORF type:complete len:283 (+),score=55.94 TRINITY_DN464_c0_g2_i4:58-906(+)
MALSRIRSFFGRSKEDIEIDLERKGDPKNILWSLPNDMVLLILSFLPVKELMRISVLSRTMRELTKNDLLWKNLWEQTHVEKSIMMPIKPPNETWRESYKSLRYFIEGGDEIKLKNNVAKGGEHPIRMAFGRFHYSGKHKYVVRIDQLDYVGIGVASTLITETIVKGGEKLHSTNGCSVYYYSGVWYGQKERQGQEPEGSQLHHNDEIHVYFDVESGKVEYYKGSNLLGRCKTFGEDEHKKGLRLGVVLKGYEKEAIVSIVDYQPVDVFPTQKEEIIDSNNQ